MLLPGLADDEAEPIDSVELYLAECSKLADEAARAAKQLVKLIAGAQKAFLGGDVSSLGKVKSEIRPLAGRLDELIARLCSFDSIALESAFREESYFAEIAELAKREGFGGVRSTEGKLFSYPYVVERKRSGVALSLGSKTIKNVRPSAVLQTLVETRKAPSKFDHVKLLDAVEAIYDVKIRGQATDLVSIEEIYRLLTILPGTEKSYAFLEFLATLDAIKRSHIATSKTSRSLDLPPASTTGKSGRAHVIVREDGREQLYHMLRFVPAE